MSKNSKEDPLHSSSINLAERMFSTPNGVIHYWISTVPGERTWLVFLPGLTADHRLFEKQIEEFEDEYNLLVWDAPGHGFSRHFDLNFSLADEAHWLHSIMTHEGIYKPVLIGQSMGGYVAQALMERYPDFPAGFIAIDSAPLKRKYMKKWEIFLLKNSKLIYNAYPWFLLKKHGAKGCSETEYGRQLMKNSGRSS